MDALLMHMNVLLTRFFHGVRRRAEMYFQRRRVYQQLDALDLLQLRDAGITPGDFDAIANGTYAGGGESRP